MLSDLFGIFHNNSIFAQGAEGSGRKSFLSSVKQCDCRSFKIRCSHLVECVSWQKCLELPRVAVCIQMIMQRQKLLSKTEGFVKSGVYPYIGGKKKKRTNTPHSVPMSFLDFFLAHPLVGVCQRKYSGFNSN